MGRVSEDDCRAAVVIRAALDADERQVRVLPELRDQLTRTYKRSDAREVVIKEFGYLLGSDLEPSEDQARCEESARERTVLPWVLHY